MADFVVPRSIRPSILVGALCGVACGVVLGAMTGPFGVAIGLTMGLLGGVIVGHVIEGEDDRRDQRTRELDEIIGTTTGDMSAGPLSLRGSLDSPSARESRAELERWATEWLTPPPPSVRTNT